MNDQRLRDDVFGPHPRIERRVRVLKDHLEAPPALTQSAFIEPAQVLAFEKNLARGRLNQLQDGAAQGRFPRSAFTDHAESLSAPHLEAHAVDGFDGPHLALQHASQYGEVNLEVDDLEDRIRLSSHDGRFVKSIKAVIRVS